MSLPAGTPIGKYVVRRKLAEGGMAEIYLCSSVGPEGFEKDVVIKRVRPSLADDPEFVRMFVTEAQLASRLNHVNIVHIYDFEKHENTYFLAMEYVRGKSLLEVRRRAKEVMEPIPPTVAAQVAMEVARALHYAHRLSSGGRHVGLVHRDVTPHNVLLSYDGAVKLTDFGIAKAGNKLTTAGTLKGKFAYMSPEQARGDEIDARTDVFALGIVLWEVLTGAALFDGDSDVAVLKAVQRSNIASPKRLNPEVPPQLDEIVLKALERDLDRRYQTAAELERALGQFLLGAAKRVEDTDVSAFMLELYPEAKEISSRESTSIASLLGLGLEQPGGPEKGGTAAIRPPRAGTESRSPDEDPHGSTMVVERDRPAPPRRGTAVATPGKSGGVPAVVVEGAEAGSGTASPGTVSLRPRQEADAGGSTPSRAVGDGSDAVPATGAPTGSALPRDEEAASGAPEAPSVAATATRNPEPAHPPPRFAELLAGGGAGPASERKRARWVGIGAALVAFLVVGGSLLLLRHPSPVPQPAPPGTELVETPPVAPAGVVSVAPREPSSDPAVAAHAPPALTAVPPVATPAAADAGTIASVASIEEKPGILRITASPFALVSIDGAPFTEVNLGSHDFQLTPGPHAVKVKHQGRNLRFDVTAESGKLMKRAFLPK